MRKFFTIVSLVIPAITFGQSETEEYKTFVFESNLPDELYHFYRQDKIKNTYALRTDLNPFYLRGDFDGDKNQDYALSVVERKTGKKGILIYHTGFKMHYVIGAGKALSNRNTMDDYAWMDAWKVYSDKDVEIGFDETTKLTLKTEAILAIKVESASGLIYWTGKEYKWYQQGD